MPTPSQSGGLPVRTLRLSENFPAYSGSVLLPLRPIVEIQKVDAVRLYGTNAIFKDVAQRLLDNTCQQRTGRHEKDGCWPSFE